MNEQVVSVCVFSLIPRSGTARAFDDVGMGLHHIYGLYVCGFMLLEGRVTVNTCARAMFKVRSFT